MCERLCLKHLVALAAALCDPGGDEEWSHTKAPDLEAAYTSSAEPYTDLFGDPVQIT